MLQPANREENLCQARSAVANSKIGGSSKERRRPKYGPDLCEGMESRSCLAETFEGGRGHFHNMSWKSDISVWYSKTRGKKRISILGEKETGRLDVRNTQVRQGGGQQKTAVELFLQPRHRWRERHLGSPEKNWASQEGGKKHKKKNIRSTKIEIQNNGPTTDSGRRRACRWEGSKLRLNIERNSSGTS